MGDFPPCDFIHDNIHTLYGVLPMPIEKLPKVCTCGRPLAYADSVDFILSPVKALRYDRETYTRVYKEGGNAND